ncbi:MAG: hypothetical protein ACD_36C00096G0003 [uncultured bacterium]|uniref:DUF11 domain-containing protein n=1 Tax=Candidatus Gottesmanbacteria bacterium RIFCSPLOWO2_01_FULL_43_11b TaxID=1798392 RepID=A0A1F6AGN9_9BACT|nr:MAG: hypothetical protein ACD_36C00096G0003 [uncultured bacterium]OGG23894.1 MAG: hypothetical protein A3A79_01700 [Candidatus Gottesmanbacteria bacterium RIFCSPLOWO2_01_FULL_43_11b]
MKKNIVLSIPLLVASSLLFVRAALAQNCVSEYGGTISCPPADLTINKEVKNPSSGLFVENLASTDATYSPGSEVLFKLTIKNTSGETFNPVTVKDVFPQYMSFAGGPGNYDKDSRTLTFTTENLVAGESRTFEILGKIDSTIPSNISCLTNLGKVSAPARPNGDDDTAQFCIQGQVLGVTTLPAAGFNDALLLLPFAAMGLGGIVLLRKRV